MGKYLSIEMNMLADTKGISPRDIFPRQPLCVANPYPGKWPAGLADRPFHTLFLGAGIERRLPGLPWVEAKGIFAPVF